jgi:phage shock protein PspC (stress-responsive transcriptional regulator)
METQKILNIFARPDKLLLGVCSAISQKINLSPTVIRIAFLVFTLFFIPFGVVLYLGLYLATGQKKSRKITFGLLGALLGVPFSYYFQSDIIKNYSGSGMFSYLRNFTLMVDQYDRFVGNGQDIVFNLLLSIVIFAILGVIVGYFGDKQIK